MKIRLLIFILCCGMLFSACGGGSQGNDQSFAEADARRVNVFSRIGGQEAPLPLDQPVQLGEGDSLHVDEGGYAILRFSDLVTVEVLRQGNLEVSAFAPEEQPARITLRQSAGTFVNELQPGTNGATRRLEIQSDFATITATGTRFLIVRELDTPLEWLWAIEAADDDLTVTADGVTRTVTTGTAYWIAPIGPPSQPISLEPAQVAGWLAALREGTFQGEMGDALWKAADVLIHTGEATGEIVAGGTVRLGDIPVTLAPEGVNGPARYAQRDCNQDGIPDIAITDGRLLFDLRAAPGRVRAVDLTVTGATQNDELRVFNSAYTPLNQPVQRIPRTNDSILSVRSQASLGEQPFHYAELSVADGCFLGISLTPPAEDSAENGPADTPGPPRSAIPDPRCVVSAAGLNLRRGPDTSFAPPIRLLRRGDELLPLGRTASDGWIRVRTIDDGSEGWISANPQYVVCAVAVSSLAPLVAPPTPTPPSAEVPLPRSSTPSRPPTSRAWQAPQLLSPGDNAIFDIAAPIELSWSALPQAMHGRGLGVARILPRTLGVDPPLRDDEYYRVTIHFSPAVDALWIDVQLTKESNLTVPSYLNSRDMSWDQRYSWSVAVVQRLPMDEVSLLSPESAERTFYWQQPPPDTPTPTPRPQDTPAATPTVSPTERPPTATPSATPVAPTETPTSGPTTTATPSETPIPTATATPQPSATETAEATETPVATDTPVPTAEATDTPIPTATATDAPVPTATATDTPVPTATAMPTPTATATCVAQDCSP